MRPQANPDEEAQRDPGRRRRDGELPTIWLAARLGLAALSLAALYIGVRISGLVDELDVEAIRLAVDHAGGWRVPLFVSVYGLGILANVPGSIFVGGGVLAFGAEEAFVWSYLGALLGNLSSFGVVRLAGYRPLARARWPVAMRLFRQIADRPLRTMILLRVVFPTTAPVNYALALSSVSLPIYLLGSLIGVLPQLLATVWVFALIVSR